MLISRNGYRSTRTDGRQNVWSHIRFFLTTLFVLGCGGESSQSFAPLNQCTKNVECKTGSICIDNTCKTISSVDEDKDGVPDIDERRLGTNPRKQDSDGDGISDKDELMFDEMTRQFNGVDSDNDGQIDAKESEEKDKDGDGVPDARDPCDDDRTVPRRVPHLLRAAKMKASRVSWVSEPAEKLENWRAMMTCQAPNASANLDCQRTKYAMAKIMTATAKRMRTLPTVSERHVPMAKAFANAAAFSNAEINNSNAFLKLMRSREQTSDVMDSITTVTERAMKDFQRPTRPVPLAKAPANKWGFGSVMERQGTRCASSKTKLRLLKRVMAKTTIVMGKQTKTLLISKLSALQDSDPA